MGNGHIDRAIKRAPQQKRAVETYERILDVATRQLVELGVERISTNLIAAQADITVPTLYRYFPNKYAVLMALGDRLMTRQNALIAEWLEQTRKVDDPAALMDEIHSLISRTIALTRATPGALAISLSLRAVPALQDVRLSSHRAMSDAITEEFSRHLPHIPRKEIWERMRLSVELCYAAIEMALEEPRVSDTRIAEETAAQMKAYWHLLLAQWQKE
jgi:AcrR family transcriptional regulator